MIIRKENSELFLYQLSENGTFYNSLGSVHTFLFKQFDFIMKELRLEFPLSFIGVEPYVLKHEREVEVIVD